MLLFATAGLSRLLNGPTRAALLMVASLLFYATAVPAHALLIVALLTGVWLLGDWLQAPTGDDPTALSHRRIGLGAGIAVCAGVLAYFKYADFFRDSLRALAPSLWPTRLTSPSAAATWGVPLGISFFTFEFIHYLVDAYRRQLQPPDTALATPAAQPATPLQRYLHFAAFALFFPTLLAGPIKRFQQFRGTAPVGRADVAYGLSRIVLGLTKKILIADSAASLAIRLQIPDQVTPLGLWIAMYAYAVQIYFDFSGYSDLAIGAARLLGYRVPENFDWPYLASDLSQFWRRWHISLSGWIRDYLYIPLGGNRRGRARTACNAIVVMSICGLWHGPAWHFVAWGAWHGIGLAVTQQFARWTAPNHNGESSPHWIRRVGSTLLTFHYVCFGWILFAAPSLPAAATAFARMLGFAAR